MTENTYLSSSVSWVDVISSDFSRLIGETPFLVSSWSREISTISLNNKKYEIMQAVDVFLQEKSAGEIAA